MSSNFFNISAQVQGNGTALIKATRSKLSKSVADYYDLMKAISTNDTSNLSYDFITSYGIVKSLDIAQVINNPSVDDNFVNVTTDSGVVQVDVETIISEIRDNGETARINLAALDVLSMDGEQSYSDILMNLNSSIQDYQLSVDQLSANGLQQLQNVKSVLRTNSTIMDKFKMLLMNFKNKDNTYVDITSLQPPDGEYTAKNSALAAFGLIDVDWSSFGSAIVSYFTLVNSFYQAVQSKIVDLVAIGSQKLGAWFSKTYLNNGYVSSNAKYSVLSMDRGSFTGRVIATGSGADRIREKFVAYNAVLHFNIPGGSLYITGIDYIELENGDWVNTIKFSFVPELTDYYIYNSNVSTYKDYSLAYIREHVIGWAGGDQYSATPPNWDFSTVSGAQKFCQAARRCLADFVKFGFLYNNENATLTSATWYNTYLPNPIDDVSSTISLSSANDVKPYFMGDYGDMFDSYDGTITHTGFTSMINDLVSIVLDTTRDGFSYPYEWVYDVPKGYFHLNSNSELGRAFNKNLGITLGVAALVVGAIVVGAAMGKLKFAAQKASAQADLIYFDPNFDVKSDADWLRWKKQLKKANMLELLFNGGSSTSVNLVQAMAQQIINTVKGDATNIASWYTGSQSAPINTILNSMPSEPDILTAIKGVKDLIKPED